MSKIEEFFNQLQNSTDFREKFLANPSKILENLGLQIAEREVAKIISEHGGNILAAYQKVDLNRIVDFLIGLELRFQPFTAGYGNPALQPN